MSTTQWASTAHAMKRGLVDQLTARPGLAGVDIYYGDTPNIGRQSIRVAQVTGSSSTVKAIAPTRRAREETYSVHVLVDVVGYSDTSEGNEVRALEIMNEITDLLQVSPQVIPEIQFATLGDWEMQSGYTQVQNSTTYGAGIDLQIDVTARLN